MKVIVRLVIFMEPLWLLGCGDNTNRNGISDNGGEPADTFQGKAPKAALNSYTYYKVAQIKIDSMQQKVDAYAKAVKRGDVKPNSNWPAVRDSTRKILDNANRSLNSQSYKSEESLKSHEAEINKYIDSATHVWKRFANNR